MNIPTMLRPARVAEILGVSTKTLSDWRLKGTGPTYVRLGEHERTPIRYPESELIEWIENRSSGRPARDEEGN